MSQQEIEQAVLTFFERAAILRADLYLEVSRGVAPRNHDFADKSKPQLVMTIRTLEDKPPELRQKGIKATTVEDIRWGRCDLKTVQLLPNLLAKHRVLEAGAYDAIFVSAGGVVREATSSNIFKIMDGTVVTHPLTPAILPGIMLMVVLDLCRSMAISAVEKFSTTDELLNADEVFLTGTTTEVLGVVEVNGEALDNRKVGLLTERL